jgi:hypothetical protein
MFIVDMCVNEKIAKTRWLLVLFMARSPNRLTRVMAVFASHQSYLVFSVCKQTAKWAKHICRHRSSLWMSWVHLWCSRGKCGAVWTICWQWSHLGFGNPETSSAWCGLAQSYPLRFTCHVPCEAHILVWHLQGENQVWAFSIPQKPRLSFH